jgi:hypothetical protein
MSQLGVNLLNVMQNVTAGFHSAECQSAESRFDECHGAILTGCVPGVYLKNWFLKLIWKMSTHHSTIERKY